VRCHSMHRSRMDADLCAGLWITFACLERAIYALSQWLGNGTFSKFW
jgi:hypothetical protein